MKPNRLISCLCLSISLLCGFQAAAEAPAVLDESVFWTAIPKEYAAATPAPQTPAAVQTKKPAPTPVPDLSQSMGDYTTDFRYTQEQKAWNLLNQDRIRQGLSPLPLDSTLSSIARLKSKDMYENGYFAHQSPTYGSAGDMLHTFGYAYAGVGENIAHHATVEKSQAAFMSSSGHRRNILGSQWKKVGIGVWTDAQGFVYVTQLFVR